MRNYTKRFYVSITFLTCKWGLVQQELLTEKWLLRYVLNNRQVQYGGLYVADKSVLFPVKWNKGSQVSSLIWIFRGLGFLA